MSNRAEIEGLKGLLAAAEKKKMEVEKAVKAMKEMRERDDIVIKMEEEKTQVEEKLKWNKEQFKHLEEAYEKLQNLFKASKKKWEEERYRRGVYLAFFKAAYALYYSEFYVKADDDIYLRPDRNSLLLAKERSHSQTYLGCLKKGPVFTDPKLKC